MTYGILRPASSLPLGTVITAPIGPTPAEQAALTPDLYVAAVRWFGEIAPPAILAAKARCYGWSIFAKHSPEEEAQHVADFAAVEAYEALTPEERNALAVFPTAEVDALLAECPRCFEVMSAAEDAECPSASCVAFQAYAAEHQHDPPEVLWASFPGLGGGALGIQDAADVPFSDLLVEPTAEMRVQDAADRAEHARIIAADEAARTAGPDDEAGHVRPEDAAIAARIRAARERLDIEYRRDEAFAGDGPTLTDAERETWTRHHPGEVIDTYGVIARSTT